MPDDPFRDPQEKIDRLAAQFAAESAARKKRDKFWILVIVGTLVVLYLICR